MHISGRSRFAIALVAAVAFPLPQSVGAMCTPVEQWRWSGPLQSPSHPYTACTPLVAQLTDDNRDGRIDAADTPDVVFTHSSDAYISKGGSSLITVVDGASGVAHFTIPTQVQASALALGDIDGDGVVEILAVSITSTSLLAFEHDGTPKFTGDAIELDDPWETLGIADLDQDGAPEIFHGNTVLDADGRFRWRGALGNGSSPSWTGTMRISHAVDLDPAQPGLELLAGGTLYGASGNVLWSTGDDGFTVPVDLDGDGDGEIVLILDPEVVALDHRGNNLGSWTAPNRKISQPLAVDVDNDGRGEVLLAYGNGLQLLRWSGTAFQSVWSRPIQDPSGANAPSAIDLDGDGFPELLHHDHVRWYIFDGRSGAILSDLPFDSRTILETVVAADIDNDCTTELIVNGCQTLGVPVTSNAVIAYECAGPTAARPIWNQYNYHQTNVNDDGTIPRVEPPPWQSHNSWHTQSTRSCGSLSVHFAAVEARWKDRATVALTWRTAAELGSVGFTVERAEGSDSFVSIPSWVAADGEAGSYQFVDSAPPAATLRYRIVEHTASGRGDVSAAVMAAPLAASTGLRRRKPGL